MSIESNELGETPQYMNVGVGLRLIEGIITLPPPKIGSMNVYVKVQYGRQCWKSPLSARAGAKPKWNAYNLFETEGEDFLVSVWDKGFLFGDSELGRCQMSITEIRQGHLTDWWSLVKSDGSVIGKVLITFDLPREESLMLTTHSSQNSVDIREEYLKQLAELESDRGELHLHLANYKQLSRNSHSIENLRKELEQENSKMRQRESKLKMLFDEAKIQSAKIKKEKAEVQRYRESLMRREQSLQMEEDEILQEKATIDREKEELAAVKAQLSHDFAKLKQERQKLQIQKHQIEETSKELGLASRNLTQQKIELKKKCTGKNRRLEDIIQF